MAKVIVVYESLFGNTRMVAESIIEGMGGGFRNRSYSQ